MFKAILLDFAQVLVFLYRNSISQMGSTAVFRWTGYKYTLDQGMRVPLHRGPTEKEFLHIPSA
jgi:hypothetical protein